MQYNLFIPEKMKAGFQYRKDTFTGKLSYIIYFDEKNKLRKEKSWLSWCNSKIDAVDFDNTPISGFVINKDIQRFGGHFNYGREMIRVYDPRGFEFEISVANLSLILSCSDISKNEIFGEMVYGIVGKDLFLIPVNSQEYIESQKFTKLVNTKMSTRDLVVGKTYLYKDNNLSNYELIYLGYYNYNDYALRSIDILSYNDNKKKKHIYLERELRNNVIKERYETVNINKIYDSESGIDNNIDQLVDNYLNSTYYKGISFKYEDIDVKDFFNSFLSECKDDKDSDKIPFLYKETDDIIIYLKGFIEEKEYRYNSYTCNKIKFKTYMFYKKDIKDMTIVDYMINDYRVQATNFTHFISSNWCHYLDDFYYEYYRDSKIYRSNDEYIINIRKFIKDELNIDGYLLPSSMFIYFVNYYSDKNNQKIKTNDDRDKFFDYISEEGFKKISLNRE